MRTVVVWCPDWPLVAAGIPATVPAALVHANRVVACTEAARAEGISRGLRRREAQSRCPTLQVEPHDPVRDARAFEPVMATLATLTPRVEVTRPGMCAFPARGPSRYFGGDAALAGRVRTVVPGCRVGIADGPFAAAVAARRDVVVAPGASAEFLAPLPIRLLDEPDLVDVLIRLGIRTLGGFAALPVDGVVGRFGPLGVLCHHRAAGLDDRDLATCEPPPDLSTQVALDPPADRVDTVAFAARAMADDLCRSLAATGMVCTALRIEADTEHGEQLSRVWRHHRSFTPAAVADRVRWQLEGWLAAATTCGCTVVPAPGGSGVADGPPCPGGPDCPNPVGGTTGGLTLLRLVPEDVIADRGHQGGFWGERTEADDRAGRGLARLQGLLGPDQVVTAVLGGGRGPAEQVRLVPWGDRREPARPGAVAPGGTAAVAPGTAAVAPGTAVAPGAAAVAPGTAAVAPGTAAVAPGGAAPAGREAPPKRRRPPREGKPGTRVRTSGRTPSPTERPAWPGRLPDPFPSVVLARPLPAEVMDGDGAPMGVTGRSLPTAAPARLSVAGGPWEEITAWAGPWPADERWWDRTAHRRLARIQVVLRSGDAHLLALEGGRWWVEASYD
jgi:protein ImuB